MYRQEVKTLPPQLAGGQLPLDSIFAKSQLDQLVADAWLQSELLVVVGFGGLTEGDWLGGWLRG